MTTAVVAVGKGGFKPYGGNREFFYYTGSEAILSGPYDTGKTYTALQKLNLLLCKYPGARALMIRKTYKSLVQSAVVTFEEKIHRNQIKSPEYPINKYGGEKPEWYDYPNRSRLVCGGLDNPGKTLSAEYDFIYVNQAEELTEDEWQAMTRAASGRAGNAPYAQVMGDCNPDVPWHWILSRKSVKRFISRHEDNPTIFDQDTGECIAPKRIEILDQLTGVRYKRGRLGLWVAAEGQVYEFDPAIHVVGHAPEFVTRYRAVDFGYTNPFVCQWWGQDYDGRLYLYREIYMTGRTVRQHAEKINELSGYERYKATIADHDAEDRATLEEHGIYTIPADKRITVGIEKVQERLKMAGDGKSRLYVVSDALAEVDRSLKSIYKPTCTEEEFTGYVYPETRDGRNADEKPIKENDHGMDALRYMVMYLDGPGEVSGVRQSRIQGRAGGQRIRIARRSI